MGTTTSRKRRTRTIEKNRSTVDTRAAAAVLTAAVCAALRSCRRKLSEDTDEVVVVGKPSVAVKGVARGAARARGGEEERRELSRC